MTFRSRSDGSHHPITPKKTVIMPDLSRHSKAWDRLRVKGSKKTLENPLLFSNFVNKLERLNPDTEFDIEWIDRSLEPEEAQNDLKKKHPELNVQEQKDTHKAEFREDLESRGIDNEKVQNLIAEADSPLSEDEIAGVAGALHTRSDHALEVDKAMKAPLTKDVRKWSKDPNRLDIRTVDDP